MKRGYLLFAVNSTEVDYVKLAYACALSIKITQPDGYNGVSLVTNNLDLPLAQSKIFDYVIEYKGPIGMDVRSRGYDFTPYNETVLLDSDLLFLNDVSHYWDSVKDMGMLIATCPRSYRHQRFKYGHYRKAFSDHQLDDVYSAWTYFKKTERVRDFFDTVKLLTDNPEYTIKNMLNLSVMKTIPTDEAFALALRITEIDAIRPEWPFPSITHMKGLVQGWHNPTQEWIDKVRMTIDEEAKIKIGVWQQKDILHYVNKSLITDQVLERMEAAYGQP